MKVYAVLFTFREETSLEGIFPTRQDARNYVYNQCIERGLYENDMDIDEYCVTPEDRVTEEEAISSMMAIWDIEREDVNLKELEWIDNL